MSDGNDDDDDEGVGGGICLSAETMAALKDFALQSGIPVLGGNGGSNESDFNIVDVVRDHFDVKDKEETFLVDYCTADNSRSVNFEVKGVKRRLGQTLNSTGLTIWRAAEHLCEYSFNNPELFRGKSVCELGCGLGMVSILLDKLQTCTFILATDGDDDTMELLNENIQLTDSSIKAQKLYWGNNVESFVSQYPDGFDMVIAADVIYEEEQVEPLVRTAAAILKGGASSSFLLAFARRNVPIGLVLTEAESVGLKWEILDAGKGLLDKGGRQTDGHAEGGMEPIYKLTWRC